jgi:hypothetical protein
MAAHPDSKVIAASEIANLFIVRPNLSHSAAYRSTFVLLTLASKHKQSRAIKLSQRRCQRGVTR